MSGVFNRNGSFSQKLDGRQIGGVVVVLAFRGKTIDALERAPQELGVTT